ncbi:hypothetical protein PF005_g4204 [Phytophthora fragariae]|uniref:Uncharacterized protein n=1 Tax=Phytophthora fragariae TaxID=53985 RepID=A0A6A3Z2Z4_9STRA|nr:hypothetical protein PF003_g23453 [Phytophthora fragariae]KAE8945720.1 hypothetical protein PF009_g4626 [Phytophthora fragariae]KAE9133695.1 hypothetical protein PF007_g3247 [Phytophthora fragariae]KAE9150555.1 hypothetical protein PF006_g5071 [Phytophthora fragariae]KAE9228670.1 hypothetical protein PF005_g4204 [Phytophthora fragariae]
MEGGESSAAVAPPAKTRRGSGAAIYEKYLNIKNNALTNGDGAKNPAEISNSTDERELEAGEVYAAMRVGAPVRMINNGREMMSPRMGGPGGPRMMGGPGEPPRGRSRSRSRDRNEIMDTSTDRQGDHAAHPAVVDLMADLVARPAVVDLMADPVARPAVVVLMADPAARPAVVVLMADPAVHLAVVGLMAVLAAHPAVVVLMADPVARPVVVLMDHLVMTLGVDVVLLVVNSMGDREARRVMVSVADVEAPGAMVSVAVVEAPGAMDLTDLLVKGPVGALLPVVVTSGEDRP